MSDAKSKLPDMKELTSMASKLFQGLKKSMEEIVQDYKEKRAGEEKETPAKETKESKKEDKKE